jgi:hypothetical protein
MVKGFNNTSSSVAATGFNTDSKPELYVPGMPEDLVLLCAADYTNSGATILLPNEGYVLSLSPEQQRFFLREFAQHNDIIKTLTVSNNTYEVAPDPISSQVAYNSTATKYFNSKVNVSTAQERILSTLLTGLTFRDLLFLTNNEAVSGLPRDLTATAIVRKQVQSNTRCTPARFPRPVRKRKRILRAEADAHALWSTHRSRFF